MPRIISFLGLLISLVGAVCGMGDSLLLIKEFRDAHSPWSDINSGLNVLSNFNPQTPLSKKLTAFLRPGDKGYNELFKIISHNFNLSKYKPPLILFSEERGVVQKIANTLRKSDLYFGIIHRGIKHDTQEAYSMNSSVRFYKVFLGDFDLLKSLSREYRLRYYTTRSLALIFVAFLAQFVALLMPANKPLQQPSGCEDTS